ncbi:MAG: ATP-binding protein [Desulfatibacillaceae bacterium]
MKDTFFGKAGKLVPRRPEPTPGENRYHRLRRNLVVVMTITAVVPLALMAVINHYQYQEALTSEFMQPIKSDLSKTVHSLELFLTERMSAVSFIAQAYDREDLADPQTLARIFSVMKQEFSGFVDLSLIDRDGSQVSYIGPYDLTGKNYRDQPWVHQVRIQGEYISDVFLGYRKFPHFVIAVKGECGHEARCWVIRATLDSKILTRIVDAMSAEATTDAFLLNAEGILQTPSKFYGDVLEKIPFELPPKSYAPTVKNMTDPHGDPVTVGYAYFTSHPFILMVVKPQEDVFGPWFALQSELLIFLVVSICAVLYVVFRVTGEIMNRIRQSDLKRQEMDHEMQYTNKLASIGRLAAGVAHEINNPLAIINEKTGLMKDILEFEKDFPNREKFDKLITSVLQSVERCRTITHRLLGFARRMDVAIEVMDLNELLREVLSFVDKESLYRNIGLRLDLDDNLPRIASDRGQLQQVFLNIINNAFEAVDDGGIVAITTWEPDIDTVAVSIRDNGHGMSEEARKHLFEPFYTTKKGYGTGLGLSITYGIVRRLGGRLEVQSREGQGTTFTVVLPKKSGITVE